MKECTIDDAVEILKNVKAQIAPGTRKIVVLDRGWVAVGNLIEDGVGLILTEAAIVRYWGTTKGLPELQGGPTSKTKLDPCSLPIRFNADSVIFTLDVDEEAWANAY